MRFKVISYNIHRAIGVDRRFKPDRVSDIIRSHDADLVLLQEVDDGVPRSRELDMASHMAEAMGYPHYAVGHNVSLKKGRYGNATLSRFPIVRERNIDLTVGERKRRGCQHTRIEMTQADGSVSHLEVFNLHLGLSARERQRQAGMLANSSEFKSLSTRCATLVAGDFNDWRSLLRAFYVEAHGFRCATDRINRRGVPRTIKTYPSFAPRGALDRMYYRGGLHLKSVRRCGLKLSRIASDHLPVIATFELSI